MKYYNTGTSLGVIGTTPGHVDGDYTFLREGRCQWIKTECLFDSYDAAKAAEPAKFL